MDNNQYDSFFWLSVIANILQVENYNLNLKDATNTEILKHLQKQDRVLDEQTKELQRQTNEYLRKIVEQNDKIIGFLEKQ